MHSEKRKLSDNEIHDRLVAACQLFDDVEGTTKQGETAIKTASRSMKLLQFALIAAEAEESKL
ncbi:hypothetical protein [Pseudovibrio sp. POLY-S9]|uniref:hypothetical protein n=1 Tax=Pseudovibrio sp. POLY-S9 TaxID=1576596 RepID=UPI00070BDD01|nr:hypothetical protein [Pseudovibrio sp. POLY-S9]